MLEKILRKLENIEDKSEEEINKIDRNVLYGINATVGVLLGTIDTISSGLPILSVGVPLWDFVRYVEAKEYMKRQGWNDSLEFDAPTTGTKVKARLSYMLGVGVPFAIQYRNEILDFASQITR